MEGIMKIVWVLRIGLACIFLLLGFLGVGFGIIGMIDPVGTKMSDDADPLGTPPSFTDSLFVTMAYATVFLLGLCLIFAPKIFTSLKTKKELP